MSTRQQVLSLYHQMMREAQHFNAYNYRDYALRRIRDGFKLNSKEADTTKIAEFISRARSDLGASPPFSVQCEMPTRCPVQRH